MLGFFKAVFNFFLKIVTPAFYKFLFEILMNFLKEINLGLKKYDLKEEEKQLLDELEKIKKDENIDKEENLK